MIQRYGKELKDAYFILQNAVDEISESALQLENGLLKLRRQIDFSQRIRHLMDQEHQEVYEKTLIMLQSKLETVKYILQGIAGADESNVMTRVRYLRSKGALDEAIHNLGVWQALTDQSWFLFMTLVDPRVEAALVNENHRTTRLIPSASFIRSSLTVDSSGTSVASRLLPHGEIEKMERSEIAFSDAKIGKRVDHSGRSAFYVLNEISGLRSPPDPQFSRYDIARDDTGQLARRLQHSEPARFGLLNCKGFTLSGTKGDPKITLVLNIPPDLAPNPRSLRDLLLNTGPPESLSQRFEIAQGLAKSVSYVHTFGFVHKNVRPESILCFSGSNGTTMATYLIGFELFRRDMGWTQRLGDTSLEKNLYRHTSRQGIDPKWNYIMQHDIYSLGVCLLEIGLWKSFVEYATDGTNTPTRAQPADILDFSAGLDESQAAHHLATEGATKLISLARNDLPRCMGTKYSEIVITCLTCLNGNNADFGEDLESQDAQGAPVGVRYIEKVVVSSA